MAPGLNTGHAPGRKRRVPRPEPGPGHAKRKTQRFTNFGFRFSVKALMPSF